MKTLELELKGFVYLSTCGGLEVWARRDERILYNPQIEEVHMKYNKNDEVAKYFEEWK